MLATSKGPLRAQQPYLRPSMRANGEISRKAHDPEFKVNQAAFYAATPDSTAVFNKDRGAFYRGSTPRRDQHTYNTQKKNLQHNAEKML